MAIIPVMRTWIDDEVVTPEMLNEQIRDAGNFNLKRPGAALRCSSSFTASMASNISPPFDIIDYDSDGMVNLSTFVNGFTIQTSGLYMFTGSWDVHTDLVGDKRGKIWISKNGPSNSIGQYQQVTDWSSTTQQPEGGVSAISYCSAGDTVGMYIFMTGTGTATCGSDTPVKFAGFWIGS